MKKNKNLKTGIIIVALIIVLTISASYYTQAVNNPNGKNLFTSLISSKDTVEAEYKNGVYSVDGQYISPGGAEEIGVTLTLENGIITDSEVEPRATREISVAMQADFAANYKELVVGKSIDEVKLTKVSGSSLTPNGFNDAVEKIKNQAKG